jgi:hypothetical protein
MATTADPARFIYRGNAMPLGGQISNVGGKPVSLLIPGPPTAALTVSGGFNRATGAGSRFENVFSWGATFAEVTGAVREDGHPVTTVTASVADVIAVNRPIQFEADLLKITLVSDHPRVGQPAIAPTEVVFGGRKGMFLDGKPVRVEWDNDLGKYPTFTAFEEQYRGSDKFFRKYRERMRRPRAKAGVWGERLPRIGGYVSTSIVRRIYWNEKKIEGHVLALEGFGRIYFGEVLMNENNRRLTMLRFAMGSDVGAQASCAEADPNGSWG